MPTVNLGLATETDSALPITAAKAVAVGVAAEADSARRIAPLTGGQSLFVPAADVQSILGPRWRLYFADNATGEPLEIYADEHFTLQHSQPVTLDRFGRLPGVYLALGVEYKITIENEFGVFRHEAIHQI